MNRALLLTLLATAGCTRTVWPETPPLTCYWLDVVEATGPDVALDDGTDLASLAAEVSTWTVPAFGDDWEGTLRLDLVEPASPDLNERVERRLPPSADVFAGATDATCLEGTLVRGTVHLVGVLEHPELGPLPIDTYSELEGGSLDRDRVALTFYYMTPWSDLAPAWRDLLRPLHRVSAFGQLARVRMGGSLTEGSLEASVGVKDVYGVVEFEDHAQVHWQ